ncbi:dynactin subunit 3 [Eurytemora carolleeae]|uniref:dynactin subunit 3 n=1 Tax=Eurytemora carolleeae TaxID=1294199 RepID=UPI000C78BC75|nr:dynactin subunit 3 [Eurytemora carolleeae]|eukprot:XP_023333841.1 dynactin subunit 3-like [Eurytemora affinis]
MMESDLSALNRRLEKLEQRTWGSKPRNILHEPLVHYVAEYSTDVGNSLVGHDRITPVVKRIEELEMYLDPLFGEKSSNTDRVKQSILLSQAGQLDQEYNMLEQIKILSGELDSQKLGDIKENTGKLEELKRFQLQEKEQADALNTQTLELVEKYNSIISSLTQAFIQIDAKVAAVEAKLKKPEYY